MYLGLWLLTSLTVVRNEILFMMNMFLIFYFTSMDETRVFHITIKYGWIVTLH